jgi:hypothetical protein
MLFCSLISAQDCESSFINFTCPYDGYNFCEGSSLTQNYIIRCLNGCPAAKNCNVEFVSRIV